MCISSRREGARVGPPIKVEAPFQSGAWEVSVAHLEGPNVENPTVLEDYAVSGGIFYFKCRGREGERMGSFKMAEHINVPMTSVKHVLSVGFF